MGKPEFLNFLVDETLKLQGSGQGNLSSLELKLNDYGLNFLKGEFIPQSQLLRFNTPFGVMDVPVTWSIFCCEGKSYTLLDKSSDKDDFFTVMKFAWKLPLEKMLILHADGFCYMVGLKSGEDSHLRDLLNPQEWLKTA